MKQVIQHLSTGKTAVVDSPCPRTRQKHCLIQTRCSLISSGTEKMMVDFARGSWLAKARQQPDKVRQVLDKVKSDGLFPTLEAVRSKLEAPLALGYCHVGQVVEIGEGTEGFQRGDRVVSNGSHAEMVAVPQHLCARIPEDVSDEAASFTIIGAIALQGIRLLNPTLGECFVVMGLGIVGLMAVQLLKANGCQVIALDFDEARCQLAKAFGAEILVLSEGVDPVAAVQHLRGGRGVDGVLITASTSNSEPIHQAATLCRQRGRIVLVGVAGLELSRDDFYKKELSFQVSCSYGPGRYDPLYEEAGQDYPLPFVRWTEQRNFEAVLQLMAEGALQPERLITHRYAIEEADKAYDLLANRSPSIGILLQYSQDLPLDTLKKTTVVIGQSLLSENQATSVKAALVGAGNYASRVLLPAFIRTGMPFEAVASSGSVSARHLAQKFAIPLASSDVNGLLDRSDINTIIIATPHHTHAQLVVQALKAGKHVFVEKPLALSLSELQEIEEAYAEAKGQQLMVGFNRRFSPFVVRLKCELLKISEPKHLMMTVNAGEISTDHWTQRMDIGGGRIAGEGCHFIDLLRHLVGAPVIAWQAMAIPSNAAVPDTASISLKFADGSVGVIHYLANGHRRFPKEELRVFAGGRVFQCENYRRLTVMGVPGFKVMKSWRQDKGQAACAKAFMNLLTQGGQPLIPFDELMEVSRLSVEISTHLQGEF